MSNSDSKSNTLKRDVRNAAIAHARSNMIRDDSWPETTFNATSYLLLKQQCQIILEMGADQFRELLRESITDEVECSEPELRSIMDTVAYELQQSSEHRLSDYVFWATMNIMTVQNKRMKAQLKQNEEYDISGLHAGHPNLEDNVSGSAAPSAEQFKMLEERVAHLEAQARTAASNFHAIGRNFDSLNATMVSTFTSTLDRVGNLHDRVSNLEGILEALIPDQDNEES